jgi:cytochrome c oxidase subunit 2
MAGADVAVAQGMAEPWQLGFQTSASPVMAEMHSFHNLLLYITVAIVIFVMALLLYVIVRFNSRANPVPRKFSHNILVEVAWTVVPLLIVVGIALKSFQLLYYTDRVEDADMTLKAIGYQWYWGYEYPDQDGLAFEAIMVEEDALEEGQPRLLTTDNAVVLPTDTNIRILTTAADVLHSWAVPALGVKMDAVPGRINETWMRIEKPGMYYGQCSELCGARHGFMPIMIRAVPKQEFETWVAEAKEQFAATGAPTLRFAQVSSSEPAQAAAR